MSMRLLAIITLILFNSSVSKGQDKCSSLEKIVVKINAYSGSKLLQQTVSISDLRNGNFEIRSDDAAYKVIGYTVCHDCYSGLSFDISCKEYYAELIKPGDPFFYGINKGALLTVDCIILVKGEQKFTANGVLFNVVE